MRIFALFVLVTASTSVAATDIVPVTIGTEGPEIDACPSIGELKKLTVVHKGPTSGFAETTRLNAGSQVHVCGQTKNGRWTSVVVALDGVRDCKVSSPVAKPQFYRGPCASGWVPTVNVRVIAG